MKKKIIIISICIVMFFIITLVYFQYEKSHRKIKTHYIDEITFDENIRDVLSNKYFGPNLHSAETIEFLYAFYLNEIFEKGQLSEERVNEIREKISNVPENGYIYISVGRKLNYIFYSDQPGSYGWNGRYKYGENNVVYLYWGLEPLGNLVDGYN